MLESPMTHDDDRKHALTRDPVYPNPLYHPADSPSREMTKEELIAQYRKIQQSYGELNSKVRHLETERTGLQKELELIRKSNSQFSYKMDAALSAQRDAEQERDKFAAWNAELRAKLDKAGKANDVVTERLRNVPSKYRGWIDDRYAVLDAIDILTERVRALEAERRGDEADHG